MPFRNLIHHLCIAFAKAFVGAAEYRCQSFRCAEQIDLLADKAGIARRAKSSM
jgi:hypothetical protein